MSRTLLGKMHSVLLVLVTDRLQHVTVRQEKFRGLDREGPRVHHWIVNRNGDVHMAEITTMSARGADVRDGERIDCAGASAVPTASIAAGAIIGLEPSQIERPGSPSMTCWRSKGRSPGFQSDAVWTTR